MAGIPKLIILSEQFRGRTFELTKDQHTVGRVDERDICIKDPTISTYHCRFVKNGNTYAVEDQGSTNGTRVNNVPVMSQVLQNSDIIQVGGVEILFDCDDKSGVTSTVQVTHTGIDFPPPSSTQTIKAITEMGFKKQKNGNGSQHLMVGIIVILSILVIGLLALVIFRGMSRNSESENEFSTNAPAVQTLNPVNPAPVQQLMPAAAPESAPAQQLMPAPGPAAPAAAAPAAVPASAPAPAN